MALRNTETKSSVTVGTKSVYADPVKLTVRVGVRNKPVPASHFFAKMSKGEARKIRKALHRDGFGAVAAQPRAN